ncbi:EscU/YscU/HrcU family type III secretion system export apparatus switch protein [Oceanibium sediminis]|uniref:EscU/YscU/HrcU family type III secretion system export apparatus switch protein n=1 Tax=Oceanibium sediminis TaxID=2026339 RepID=UPI000DD3A4A4|nr:flagellar type III secretion system protein FlhB [Oceanibium sediminis]
MSGRGEDSGEKTHEPTPKKLEDARKKGDVPRSDEVTGAAAYLGLLIGVSVGGQAALTEAAQAMAVFLDRADGLTGVILGPGGMAVLAGLLGDAGRAISGFFLFPFLGAALSVAVQQAVVVSGDKILPKLSRLSPIASVKNKFGPTGLMEFLKRFIKMLAVSGVVFVILWLERDVVIGAVRGAPGAVMALLLSLALDLLIGVTVLSVAISALDLAWVRFDHRRKLRMSFQELKDESKEAEGDPMLKARRRRRAHEIATNRMLADVPDADVVLVNPTHIAVALRWARTPGSAPECVAKGKDELAATIRERAEAAGVPIHRDPPTARALFEVVEVGQEVRPDHYRAVAASIRFAEDMRRRARGGPGT